MAKWGKVAAVGLVSGAIGAASTVVLTGEGGMQHVPYTQHVAMLVTDGNRKWVKPAITHFIIYGALGAAIAAIVT